MIASLTGTIAAIMKDAAVIEVHGVGYETRMPASDLASMHIGQQVTVHTRLNVSQDAISLYGFLSKASKDLFLSLQKVSGIGPKVALSIVSTLGPKRLLNAVADGDATALSKAPGLGKKGAQKIILELKGSIDLDDLDAGETASVPADSGTDQVVEALVSLGWQQRDALQAVRRELKNEGHEGPVESADVPRLLKATLASMDRGR
ncbi:Holliday junction branch migration protein RuvA [Bifidobacterium sp. SMB2]|uniref:Holliday junction branch migration complex subunit RuvA n=1 Tax=Bifidobacterium saimiriisciurei TaxID=2661627 RepID=A0ABX0CB21_9BIFI|nr:MULTISPECIES: Holliday junction branch migration protein RuvA [Bifidobacterium]NEG96830.1 Holliday junction branch migration protein RuvA [Bifidobacterium sp. SMB2]NEH12299.1 Holliday junction branch migration protein RuvA [Bifidobacterium saimiriisciurei]